MELPRRSRRLEYSNENYALFLQDKWQILPNLSLSMDCGGKHRYSLIRDCALPDSLWRESGRPTLSSMAKFQTPPNVPTASGLGMGTWWQGKSVVRSSWGIYNAQQNMLTQVGAITTNGVQSRPCSRVTWLEPGLSAPTACSDLAQSHHSCSTASRDISIPAGITVFDKNYANPRPMLPIWFLPRAAPNWAGYFDLTWSQGCPSYPVRGSQYRLYGCSSFER